MGAQQTKPTPSCLPRPRLEDLAHYRADGFVFGQPIGSRMVHTRLPPGWGLLICYQNENQVLATICDAVGWERYSVVWMRNSRNRTETTPISHTPRQLKLSAVEYKDGWILRRNPSKTIDKLFYESLSNEMR